MSPTNVYAYDYSLFSGTTIIMQLRYKKSTWYQRVGSERAKFYSQDWAYVDPDWYKLITTLEG